MHVPKTSDFQNVQQNYMSHAINRWSIVHVPKTSDFQNVQQNYISEPG